MTLPSILTLAQATKAIRKTTLTPDETDELNDVLIPAITNLFLRRCSDSVTAGSVWPPEVVLAAKDVLRQQWAIDHQGNRPQLGGQVDTDTTTIDGYVISRRAYGWLQGLLKPGGFA